MMTIEDVQNLANAEGVHISAEAARQIIAAITSWEKHVGSQPRPADLTDDEIEISQMGFIAGYVAAKRGL